jgi:hypothetical protein
MALLREIKGGGVGLGSSDTTYVRHGCSTA